MVRSDRPLIAVVATMATAGGAAAALRPGRRPPQARIDPASYFTRGQLRRARRFRRPQAAIGLAAFAVEAGTMAVLARRWRVPETGHGGDEALRADEVLGDDRLDGGGAWGGETAVRNEAARGGTAPWDEETPGGGGAPGPDRPGALRTVTAGAGAGALVTTAVGVSSLPLSILSRRRSLRVGLATGSWKLWRTDLVRSTALTAAAGAVMGGGAAGMQRRWPRHWWAPAAAGATGLSALLGFLAPVLLEPLFGKTEPLRDERLLDGIQEVAERAGAPVGRVLVSDASQRTSAVNAYVSGYGRSRRVVLWDTLSDGYPAEQVLFVVAHELSHVAHRDVLRNLTFLAAVAPVALWATAEIARAITPRGEAVGAVPSRDGDVGVLGGVPEDRAARGAGGYETPTGTSRIAGPDASTVGDPDEDPFDGGRTAPRPASVPAIFAAGSLVGLVIAPGM
ncbi:MAG: M48 family metalloprotease, partial [Solirubrobacteraceae bacterium]